MPLRNCAMPPLNNTTRLLNNTMLARNSTRLPCEAPCRSQSLQISAGTSACPDSC
jgi:hypothetical protein